MSFEFDKVKDILACPQSKAALILDGKRLVSADPEGRWAYPIVEDIPRLLGDEATQLPQDEWQSIMDGASSNDS